MPEIQFDARKSAQFFGEHAMTADRVIYEMNVGLMARGLPRLRREGTKMYWDAVLIEILTSMREEGVLVDREEMFGPATLNELKRRWEVIQTGDIGEVTEVGDSGWSKIGNVVLAERHQFERTAPCMPVEMPELRTKLLAKWSTAVWRSAGESALEGAKNLFGYRASSAHYTALAQYQTDCLNRADLWWVGPDMCDLLYATMDKVPDDVLPANLTVPSAYGFVVLAKPWVAHVGDGDALYIDGVTWGPARLSEGGDDFMLTEGHVPSLSVSTYACIDWEHGLSKKELEMAVAMGLHESARRTAVARPDGSVGFALSGQDWIPYGTTNWATESPLGRPLDLGPEADEADETTRQQWYQIAQQDRRFIAALFTLLATHSVAETEERGVPRPIKRRLERAGHAAPSKVKVVYLRRPDRDHGEHTEGSGSSVQWSHRWVVSAHMRNQPYGPGRAQRRLILIPAHVKGPADLPVVVKDTVKAWVR